MSVSAKDLAERMAAGELDRLPRLTADADPGYARDLLGAYYRLFDAVEAERAEFSRGWTVSERIAVAAVALEIEGAIADARRWLSRVARRGGRGVPVALMPAEREL